MDNLAGRAHSRLFLGVRLVPSVALGALFSRFRSRSIQSVLLLVATSAWGNELLSPAQIDAIRDRFLSRIDTALNSVSPQEAVKVKSEVRTWFAESQKTSVVEVHNFMKWLDTPQARSVQISFNAGDNGGGGMQTVEVGMQKTMTMGRLGIPQYKGTPGSVLMHELGHSKQGFDGKLWNSDNYVARLNSTEIIPHKSFISELDSNLIENGGDYTKALGSTLDSHTSKSGIYYKFLRNFSARDVYRFANELGNLDDFDSISPDTINQIEQRLAGQGDPVKRLNPADPLMAFPETPEYAPAKAEKATRFTHEGNVYTLFEAEGSNRVDSGSGKRATIGTYHWVADQAGDIVSSGYTENRTPSGNAGDYMNREHDTFNSKHTYIDPDNVRDARTVPVPDTGKSQASIDSTERKLNIRLLEDTVTSETNSLGTTTKSTRPSFAAVAEKLTAAANSVGPVAGRIGVGLMIADALAENLIARGKFDATDNPREREKIMADAINTNRNMITAGLYVAVGISGYTCGIAFAGGFATGAGLASAAAIAGATALAGAAVVGVGAVALVAGVFYVSYKVSDNWDDISAGIRATANDAKDIMTMGFEKTGSVVSGMFNAMKALGSALKSGLDKAVPAAAEIADKGGNAKPRSDANKSDYDRDVESFSNDAGKVVSKPSVAGTTAPVDRAPTSKNKYEGVYYTPTQSNIVWQKVPNPAGVNAPPIHVAIMDWSIQAPAPRPSNGTINPPHQPGAGTQPANLDLPDGFDLPPNLPSEKVLGGIMVDGKFQNPSQIDAGTKAALANAVRDLSVSDGLEITPKWDTSLPVIDLNAPNAIPTFNELPVIRLGDPWVVPDEVPDWNTLTFEDSALCGRCDGGNDAIGGLPKLFPAIKRGEPVTDP